MKIFKRITIIVNSAVIVLAITMISISVFASNSKVIDVETTNVVSSSTPTETTESIVTTKPTTEPTTESTTEKITEKATEKVTEKPTEETKATEKEDKKPPKREPQTTAPRYQNTKPIYTPTYNTRPIYRPTYKPTYNTKPTEKQEIWDGDLIEP